VLQFCMFLRDRGVNLAEKCRLTGFIGCEAVTKRPIQTGTTKRAPPERRSIMGVLKSGRIRVSREWPAYLGYYFRFAATQN